MKHFIIGTAGHIDHGKTHLVKALTGVETDRLKEEKQRGISIELGFAPLHLKGGQTAGIVDVPGHERFVKQMLAGVGGIDLVLFVVAADEGVMPQTKEHLDIIELLQINQGIFVITKKDLVEEDWLLLVEEELRELAAGTVLNDAPLVTVSSVTGEGITELRDLIEQMAQRMQPRSGEGVVKLPVDRIFSVTGFGTVVTGTLFSGTIQLGDNLEFLPEEKEVRVRNLQVHGEPTEKAVAGQRTAVNVSGIEVGDISRGSVLTTSGAMKTVRRLDVELHLLSRIAKPLRNWSRVRFHLAAKEALGRVRLLDREEMQPGETVFAQIVMEEPVVAAKGDRFVIRFYSPMLTIGGGTVIEGGAVKHKRYRTEVLKNLESKQSGSPTEMILAELPFSGNKPYRTISSLVKTLNLPEKIVQDAVNELKADGRIRLINDNGEAYLVSEGVYAEWEKTILEDVAGFHRKYPLRRGFLKEEMRTRRFSELPVKFYNSILRSLVKDGKLQVQEQSLAIPDFTVKLNETQEALAAKIEKFYLKNLFQPPTWTAVKNELGLKKDSAEEFLHYFTQSNMLVKVFEDVYFHRQAVEEIIQKLKAYIQENGAITIGEARDLVGTSRKYMLPFLEYLDYKKVTRRVGDKRILYKS